MSPPARLDAAPARAEARAERPARLEARDAAFALGVFVAALLLRLALVSALGAEPTWDGQFYHRGALSIAEGHGYSEAAPPGSGVERLPWSHYPVGYSAFLGGVYALFGASPEHALVANAVVGALTASLAFLFALELLGRARARVAGALVALHPGLSLYCALVMTEPLAGFLVLLTGYLAHRFGQQRWGPVASGAALALGAFVRPQSLLTLPLLGLLFRGSLGRRALATVATGAICLGLLAPWGARNCLSLDGCTLISTNGGWNLAIGALSETGRFRPLTPADGCAGVDGPVAQDRCWADVGWAEIRRDPWAWLGRIPDKLRHTYNHESFAVAYLAEASPDEWERDHTWQVMNVMTALHHVLMMAAALGTIGRFSLRRWREHWGALALCVGLLAFAAYALSLPERPLFWIGVVIPVLGLVRLPGAPPVNHGLYFSFGLLAVTSLTHMVFFGDDRYHLAISPVLCILAAAALRRPGRAPAVAPARVALRPRDAQAPAE